MIGSLFSWKAGQKDTDWEKPNQRKYLVQAFRVKKNTFRAGVPIRGDFCFMIRQQDLLSEVKSSAEMRGNHGE